MPVHPILALIVDGNNLAHYLYELTTHNPVSVSEIWQLSMQLSGYVRSAGQPVMVELCLDHFPPDEPPPDMAGVKVLVAGAAEDADELLLQRFRFHHHQGWPCVVITNDEAVCEDVQAEGGKCLLAYDFVRRQGKKPVFRSPQEFQSLLRVGAAAGSHPLRPQPAPKRPARAPAPPRAAVPPLTPAPPPELPEKPPASEPPAPPSPPQPAYRLTLETWPLAAGVRFLVDSFCPQHGDEYRKLYRSLKDHPLVQADLTELAAALVESCGQEPGFAARGSLLDRVRLALLLSPNEDVPLAVVVERTGLNPRGLHGRIKEKARGWLKIV